VPITPVVHNAQASRFEAHVDGHLCVADYRLRGAVMVMHHTEVPSVLRGRGIAAALVQAALEHAAAQRLTVEPRCSYVASYMQRHPETQALRAPS
jgi:predicted GNAT family acetyltransferase